MFHQPPMNRNASRRVAKQSKPNDTKIRHRINEVGKKWPHKEYCDDLYAG